MKSKSIFIVFAIITSILVSGIVWSKPGNEPPADPPPAFDVNVVNTPLDVNVQSAAVEQVSVDQVGLGVRCAGRVDLYTVPDGYRLKIVDASARALDESNPDAIIADAYVTLSLNSRADEAFWKVFIAYSNEIPLGGGRATEVYADPGEIVQGGVEGCQNDVNARFSFNGYLIPVED
jgi:hypothetical protein